MAKKKDKIQTSLTQEYLDQSLIEFGKNIIAGIEKMFSDQNKKIDKLEKGQKRLEDGQNENSASIAELKEGQEDIKETFNDIALKHPSSEEFNALKKKALRHHPSN